MELEPNGEIRKKSQLMEEFRKNSDFLREFEDLEGRTLIPTR